MGEKKTDIVIFENKETIEPVKSKTYSSYSFLINSFRPSMNPQLEMNFLFWPSSKTYLPPLMSLSLYVLSDGSLEDIYELLST